ncbi:MAG: peptidoglycan DD-metalloendopeptidase family protein [Bacteroidia bacterium]
MITRKLTYLAIVLMLSPVLQAQRKTRSEAERARILQQIKLSHNLLKNTNQKQDESIVELATLNNQIRLQESLLETYQREIVTASIKIDSLESRLCEIEEEVQHIRTEYARLANVTYRKLDSENRLLYVLGARSLGEAYARISYFRQIAQYRKRNVNRLEAATIAIRSEQSTLNKLVENRKQLLNSKAEELGQLEESKEQHNSLYFALKDKEDAYRDRLIKQRDRLRGMLTAAEKRSSRPKKATKPAVVNTPSPAVASNAPAPKPAAQKTKAPVRAETTPALTGQFAQNRGKLPWPISRQKAVLAGKFGSSRDAFGNRVMNDGIFLQTNQYETVQAVFAGTITGVTQVPLSGYLVIIEHGKYRTAYAGLKNVTVKVGQEVSAGNPLGNVHTDGRTGETTLQFMVYKAPNRFENPTRWLRR